MLAREIACSVATCLTIAALGEIVTVTVVPRVHQGTEFSHVPKHDTLTKQ
jgi:hypothetical protein